MTKELFATLVMTKRIGRLLVMTTVALALPACSPHEADELQVQRGAVVTPTFVQQKSATPQSSPTSVTVNLSAAQTAGNLNVAIVGWNDSTASVTSVTDTKGNTYQLAIGPTRRTGALSQSIYYAKNIATATAGSNTVTVAFSPAASSPDVRVLEYHGIDPVNPLDVAVAGTGAARAAAAAPWRRRTRPTCWWPATPSSPTPRRPAPASPPG